MSTGHSFDNISAEQHGFYGGEGGEGGFGEGECQGEFRVGLIYEVIIVVVVASLSVN
jgi:hypothetical protein